MAASAAGKKANRRTGARGATRTSSRGGPGGRAGSGRRQSLLADAAEGGANAPATGLVRIPASAGEADIQDRIAAWLRSEGIDYTLQYRTQAGPIDIHLKHLRTIIEVKRRARLDRGPGAAGSGSGKSGKDESAEEQIARYVDSLRAYGTLDAGGIGWRGVVTDGRRWWVWEWPRGDRRGSAGIVPGWNGRTVAPDDLGELRAVLVRDGAALPWAPDDPTGIFEPLIEEVGAVYGRNRSLPNTEIQKRLWLEQLKGGGRYPSPANEDGLFVRHTLLIVIARMVSGIRRGGSVAGKGRGRGRAPGGGTDPLLEGFVGWMEHAPDILARIQSVIDRYDWQSNQTDVMRTLYMGFIPIEQRKSYGEYYTPDWVAEKMCIEVIDDRYIARQVKRFLGGEEAEPVLDPACGSGTFLHHAVLRLRNSRPVCDAALGRRRLEDFLCGMVRGVDLHPVAVEMAIANMARMLPGVERARLHVYQGDSMLADAPRATLDGVHGNAVTLRADGEMITLPRRFVGGRPDAIDGFVASAVEGRERLPQRLFKGLEPGERDVLRRAHRDMAGIVERNGNGVWGWYIRNQSAPVIMADAGNTARIVSNAPWVRFSEIRDRNRQKKIEDLGKEMQVYAGGEMKTALDIAAVFVARCNSLYLAPSGRAGWVIPVTAIAGAGQWERLRTNYSGKIRGFWNLGTYPFPGQGPCCTMLYGAGAGRGSAGAAAADAPPQVLRLVLHGPNRPNEHDGWSGVVSRIARLEEDSGAGRGGHGPDSRPLITAKLRRPSAWVSGMGRGRRALARQGAILTPSMLVRIEPAADEEGDDDDGDGGDVAAASAVVNITTVKSTHGVWRGLGTRSAAVPRAWIRTVILGRDILPFAVPTPTPHVIPIGGDGEWLADRNRRGYWRDACGMYADNCGVGAHTPKTLEGQLDYHGKLSSQFPAAQWMVAYNTSGERLFAAAVRGGRHIVESSAYRVPCDSRQEADFLAAMLNADAMQRALCETKRSPRHYHTYFWDSLPIPRYDRSNGDHRAMAALGRKAGEEAARMCAADPSIGRTGVVAGLQRSGLAREIDVAAKKIMPQYVSMKHGLDKRKKARAKGRARAHGEGQATLG